MLSFAADIRLFLAHNPVDFRKSFNGLAAYVESRFHMKTISGDIFIFLNKRCTQVEILFWDRGGFCHIAKRLEQGTLHRIRQASQQSDQVEISPGELTMLPEGIDARDIRQKKRYIKPKKDGDCRLIDLQNNERMIGMRHFCATFLRIQSSRTHRCSERAAREAVPCDGEIKSAGKFGPSNRHAFGSNSGHPG